MYASTSYQPMRTGVLIPRQRPGKPRELGCVHPQRPGRSNDRRKAIAESAGTR
jgi:hypothetical protein